jgi:hypothetical protein
MQEYGRSPVVRRRPGGASVAASKKTRKKRDRPWRAVSGSTRRQRRLQNLKVAPRLKVRPISVWNNVSSRTLSMNSVLRSSVRFCASKISVKLSLMLQDAET